MTSRELATELEPILTELEMAAEKAGLAVWTLAEHYLHKNEPSEKLLTFFYAHLQTFNSITYDYLLEIFDKIEELKGILEHEQEETRKRRTRTGGEHTEPTSGD